METDKQNDRSLKITKEERQMLLGLGKRALGVQIAQSKIRVINALENVINPDSRLINTGVALEEAIRNIYNDMRKYGFDRHHAVELSRSLTLKSLASVVESIQTSPDDQSPAKTEDEAKK